MANGYDRIKIGILEFIEWLLPFRGDDKSVMLRRCFEILDIDRDGYLNILNLLHLSKNLKPRTLLSHEIVMLMDEYLRANLLNSSKRVHRVDINFEGYHKLHASSNLQFEIRRKFWGLKDPYEALEPPSICDTLDARQLLHYYTEAQLEDRSFMYENIDYYEDVMSGQRGFGRNIDRLSNHLINFYHAKFPTQAKETVAKIEEMNKSIEVKEMEELLQDSSRSASP